MNNNNKHYYEGIIKAMTHLLDKTDYKVIKYLEGQLSDPEYQIIHNKRISWRNTLNEAEEQLNKLNKS